MDTDRAHPPLPWITPSTPTQYVFRLYVSDATPASARAVVNVRAILDKHLQDRHRLEIFSIAENIEQAAADHVIAAPTLIQVEPGPSRRFIGDLANPAALLRSIGVAT